MHTPSLECFHNFRTLPAAHWQRSERGNRVELNGPQDVVIVTYGRRRTRDFRTCIIRTRGLKRLLPFVDFRRVRHSTVAYADEDTWCRSGWANIRQRIVDAAGAA